MSALLEELARAPDRASSPPPRLHPGERVGRFDIVRELGRGGFGVVYEARDQLLGRPVAFKVVTACERSEQREESILREAELAARLSHPNIVTLYDVGRSEHGPYLVLELLHGRTLAERLADGPLSPREALRIATAVASGLGHAHAHGVVHRDLSPANVFLCDDGQVKVLDLGLAHAFGHRKVHGGTPAYMAPEQRRGAPEDERTDVFTLGVILFRMLSDELPFAERRDGPLDGHPAPALQVREAPAVGPLVGRMLEIDPVRRPRDATEVASALAAFRDELSRAPGGAPVRVRRRPRARAGLLVALGIAAGAAGAFLLARHRRAADATTGAPSVAVLPFADLSPQRDQGYLADGLSEEILNALTQIEGLRVVGRSSSFSFRGRDEDLRTIGRELDVSTVLEGSLRKEGNRVRITAEVVNVEDGFRLWAQSFDRELTGIFAIEDEIARAVVGALKVRLAGGREPSTRRRTPNPEVYNHYLLGQQFLARSTPADSRRAAAAFGRAVALAPDYAPAWAGAAEAAFWVADTGEGPPWDGYERAFAAAERAVALDPGLAEAYAIRGFLRSVLRLDWGGARADFERALALNPGRSDTYRLYAKVVLAPLGQVGDALAMARKAVELDPLSAVAWMHAGYLQLIRGELREAAAMFERSLEIAPDQNFAPVQYALVFLLEKRPAEALATARRSTHPAHRLMGETMALHDLGDAAGSQRALDELIARFADTAAYQIADVYAWRGERDRAFEWLDKAFAQHDTGRLYLMTDVMLRSLRSDPRYAALLRQLHLPGGG